MAAFRRAVGEGAWPLWNPHLGFGAPLLADASFQIAYPPTWLALAVPLDAYYTSFAAGHCLWAALGTLVLARRLGLGRLGAAVAGGAFAVSGPLLSAASLFHHYAGASWMPWVLGALECLIRRPGRPAAAGLALAAGGQLLAGSGDMCLATAVIGGARIAWHVARSRPSGTEARRLAAGATSRRGPRRRARARCSGSPRRSRPRGGRAPARARRARTGRCTPRRSPTSWCPASWPTHPSSPSCARPSSRGGRRCSAACTSAPSSSRSARSRWRPARGAPGWLRPERSSSSFAALGRHTALFAALAAAPGFALMRYPQKHLLPLALCTALVAGFGASAWAAAWPSEWRRRGRFAAWALAGLGAALALCAAWLAGAPAALGPLLEDPGELGPAALAASLRVARTALLFGALGLLLSFRAGRERAPALATVLLVSLAALDLVAVGRTVNPLAPA